MKHGWTLTRSPRMTPQRCAVFPHVRSSLFIDTGTSVMGMDPHVYISETAAKELGEYIGMVPGSRVQSVRTQLDAEKAKVAELTKQVAELERFKAAVELVKAEL